MSEIAKIVDSIGGLNKENIDPKNIENVLKRARQDSFPIYSMVRILNSQFSYIKRSFTTLNKEGWIYAEPVINTDLKLEDYIFMPAVTGRLTKSEKHYLYELAKASGIGNNEIEKIIEQILKFKDNISSDIKRSISQNIENVEIIKKAKSVNLQNDESFTDPRDGKTYDLIKIGHHVWMAENLGWLPFVSPSIKGSNNSPYYYIYGFEGISVSEAKSTSHFKNFGALYNWQAAKISCPAGWRLPSVTELEQMFNVLGSAENAGGEMKSKTGWARPNEGATNLSGFSALPGGARCNNGIFSNIDGNANFWTGTELNDEVAFSFLLSYSSTKVTRNKMSKDSGFSIRCIRD